MDKDVKIGDRVTYVDPERKSHNAIVICVFSRTDGLEPPINVVMVDPDPKKDDSWGRQIVRETSVSYKSQAAPGRYWEKAEVGARSEPDRKIKVIEAKA